MRKLLTRWSVKWEHSVLPPGINQTSHS